MAMMRLIGCLLGLSLLTGCFGGGVETVEHVTVGTFNIRWLFPKGYETPWLSPPRGDVEFDRLAKAIIETKADILGLQEICADAAVLQLVDALKAADPAAGWSCHDANGRMLRGRNRNGTPSVDMEVAVIYKSSVLRVTTDRKASWRFDLSYASAKPGVFEREREPLLVHVRVRPDRVAAEAEPLDFDLMVCHMKSLGGGHYERLKTVEVARFLSWWSRRRTEETADASTWAAGVYDPDFLLVGDFNAPLKPKAGDERGKIGRRLVWRIFEQDGLRRVKFAAGAEPGTYILPPWQGTIDHICISDAAEAQRRSDAVVYKLDKRIAHDDLPSVRTEVSGEMRVRPAVIRLSDHRPVTLRLQATEAN